MGPGRFFPPLCPAACSARYDDLHDKLLPEPGPKPAMDPFSRSIIARLAASGPQPKVLGLYEEARHWPGGGRSSNVMLLSSCRSSARSRSPNPMSRTHSPQSRIGDPSSRLPHHPSLGRGKAQAKNTTCQRGQLALVAWLAAPLRAGVRKSVAWRGSS